MESGSGPSESEKEGWLTRYHLARIPTRYAPDRAFSEGAGADKNKYVALPSPSAAVTSPTVVTTPSVLPECAASSPAWLHWLPVQLSLTVLL